MAWARGIKTGSATVKSVLLAVANYADEEGVCWPSHRQLCEDTELSRNSVIRALEQLENLGLLHREGRYRDDGSRTSDLITLDLGASASVASPRPTVAPPRPTKLRSTVGHPPSHGATAEPIIEPLITKNTRGSRLSEDWVPSEASIAKAVELGFEAHDLRTEIEKFKNYWIAKAGASAVKVNWQRTFQNWLITASSFKTRRNVIGFEPRQRDAARDRREQEEREVFLKHLVK